MLNFYLDSLMSATCCAVSLKDNVKYSQNIIGLCKVDATCSQLPAQSLKQSEITESSIRHILK